MSLSITRDGVRLMLTARASSASTSCFVPSGLTFDIRPCFLQSLCTAARRLISITDRAFIHTHQSCGGSNWHRWADDQPLAARGKAATWSRLLPDYPLA